MKYILPALLGYLFGSLPFALIIGKVFYNTDVREHGSGNLGASNAGRVLGKKAGLAVTLLDGLKGFIAMSIMYLLKADDISIMLAGFFATLGHAFALFAQFKGGKSVATYYGLLLGSCFYLIENLWPFVLALATFLIVLKLGKMTSLASMISTFIGALTSLFFVNDKLYISIMLFVVVAFIIYRHRSNIIRIKNNNENKVTWI